MPREKSAGAIIFRKENGVNYYLLLHYFSGHWEFPKGHIEKGESEEETLKRETFEETGINDIKIIPGFKKYIKYFFRQYQNKIPSPKAQHPKTPLASPKLAGGGGWVFKLVTFFVAETKIKEIKISSEHKGFVWLPIDEAIKKTTFKNSKKLLKEANDFVVKRDFT